MHCMVGRTRRFADTAPPPPLTCIIAPVNLLLCNPLYVKVKKKLSSRSTVPFSCRVPPSEEQEQQHQPSHVSFDVSDKDFEGKCLLRLAYRRYFQRAQTCDFLLRAFHQMVARIS